MKQLKTIITPLNLYHFALLVLIVAVPTSNYLMSMSQMMLLTAWIWHGHFGDKLRALISSKAALISISLYGIHIIGLIYTSDFDYAFKDLRTKLPLLILPIVLATMPKLETKTYSALIWAFAVSILLSSLYSLHIYYSRDIVDTRQISVFISHIRFSLCIVMAIFLLFFVLQSPKVHLNHKVIGYLLIGWFIVFLIILGAITGIVALVLSIVFLVSIKLITKVKPVFRLAIPVTLLVVVVGTGFYLRRLTIEYVKPKPINFANLDKFSSHANIYLHDTCIFGKENGSYVGIYFCPYELPQAWAKRSKVDYFGTDKKGQHLSATLIRYLNSKGYRKDAEGVQKLTNEEITLIENGVANSSYLISNPIKKAWMQFLFGYEQYLQFHDTRGSSVMQRIELWQASINIISKNLFFGVGTGDLPNAFKLELKEMESKLQDSSLRSHNQFLSITVGFGLMGLMAFLFILIYPPYHTKKFQDKRYLLFFFIFVLSLLNEDTIESQAGVTFFAFFNSLLIFGLSSQNKETL